MDYAMADKVKNAKEISRVILETDSSWRQEAILATNMNALISFDYDFICLLQNQSSEVGRSSETSRLTQEDIAILFEDKK